MFRNRKKQEELDDEPAFFENVAAPATEMIPQPKQEEVEKMEGAYDYDAVVSVQWAFGYGLSYTQLQL